MTITRLIEILEKIKTEEGGEILVVWDSLSHTFEPDPVVRHREVTVVVLNS